MFPSEQSIYLVDEAYEEIIQSLSKLGIILEVSRHNGAWWLNIKQDYDQITKRVNSSSLVHKSELLDWKATFEYIAQDIQNLQDARAALRSRGMPWVVHEFLKRKTSIQPTINSRNYSIS